MASPSSFLAVDIGTSRTKGIIVNSLGNIVAESSLIRKNIIPKYGWHENDPLEHWWGEFVKIVKDLFDKSPASQKRIESICVSGMWPTYCPTDNDGNPLYNAILYDDIRSVDIVQKQASILGAKLYGYELIPRILWFKKNRPDIWKKTKKIFSTHSFIVYKLTKSYCLDGHTAYAHGSIFDEERFQWDEQQLNNFGVSLEIMPLVFPPSKIAGVVSESAAKITGLRSGTPVLVGTGDTFISVLSSGASKQGDAMLYYGSVGLLVRITQSINYIVDADSYIDGDEGLNWLLSLPKSGKQLEWLIRLLAQTNEISEINYDYFDMRASHLSPGESKVFYVNNLEPNNMIISVTPYAALLGISTNTRVEEIYLSFLEAFGYKFRESINDIKQKKRKINKIFAAGGGAHSKFWRQTVSDIINVPQLYSSKSNGVFGGAILAGHGVGALDLSSYTKNIHNDLQLTTPNPKKVETYNKLFRKYQEKLKAL